MRSIFINLPVADVAASRAFFTGLGFGVNETFSGEGSVAVVVEENITVMLLSHEHFGQFVTSGISDAHSAQEVLLSLSCESREEVDRLLATALDLGAKPWKPTFEMGPMYGGSFQDPDGHVWELGSMPADFDPASLQQG
ncbi:MAG: glyoxalase [Frankiales bacterium]|nr:glyoxalase [Frankiales bacterium]